MNIRYHLLYDQVHIIHWTNMTLWFLHQMILLKLVAYILAYDDTDLCQVCQTPVIQNPRVPWKHLLNNSTYYFSGKKFRTMIRGRLPNNSFVSGTYVQVCIRDLYYSPSHFLMMWLIVPFELVIYALQNTQYLSANKWLTFLKGYYLIKLPYMKSFVCSFYFNWYLLPRVSLVISG